MTGSGFAREARRRPEMDLLVGPIEAAGADAADHRVDAGEPTFPSLELAESPGLSERPSRREDG